MRIKIIGENNCARATRHLLRLAGFAVTDYLPADAVLQGPAAGYAITIDVSRVQWGELTPACSGALPGDLPKDHSSDLSPATYTPNAHLRPDCATQEQLSSMSEPAVAENPAMAGLPSFPDASGGEDFLGDGSADDSTFPQSAARVIAFPGGSAESAQGSAGAGGGLGGYIHFDSVDSALETAVLRHVAQLATGPVIVDRPGGVVHSERELRIVAPCTSDARADEAAAVAIEFGVLRGLLDLVSPDARGGARWNGAGKRLLRAEDSSENTFVGRPRKNWWPFFLLAVVGGLGVWSGGHAAVVAASGIGRNAGAVKTSGLGDPWAGTFGSPGGLVGVWSESRLAPFVFIQGNGLAPLKAIASSGEMVGAVMEGDRLKPVLLAAAPLPAEPQGQFATGQGVKITDGVNFLVVDPCKASTKFYASINQTGNTQLIAGTAAKKIYVCSIHVVAAAATDVAVVEGTGTVCATGTAGVSGFGGATAATGWNFAGNGGIALGNGDSSLGAEGASGDNLCIFNSGSGQVSGGISYVVE